MIGAAWAFLASSAIGRTLAKIGAAVLLVLSFGAYRHRQGVNDANAKRAAADAKETIKAHEVRNEVEDRVARDGDARGKLHDQWRE